ncbi:MAG: rhodanese-like domain-containing protein [Actinomycetota bacterium]
MILEQHYLDCLSQASYLIADAGRAVVVDPRRDIGVYLDSARRHGVRIDLIIETHVHADFLSGHRELAAATGASIAYGPGADVDGPVRRLVDGERIPYGAVSLEILHTPGHTHESICVVVHDHCGRPHAVLTGDTMFVGEVGRPDLVGGGADGARAQARRLHDSIHSRLLTLPDETLVYPGHGAGSACGTGSSTDLVSSIGTERATSPALAGLTLAEFVDRATEGRGTPPPHFARTAELNRRIRPLLDESAPVDALTPSDVARRRRAGHVVVDAREPHTFAQRHLADSVNLPLSARFAELAGALLPFDRDLILMTARGDEREARNRLARVGLDRIAGYSVALPDADLRRSVRRSPADVAERLKHPPRPTVLDVRSRTETERGVIESSLPIPLPELVDRLDELDGSNAVIVVCASGTRSSVAASLLRRNGFTDVSDLASGLQHWPGRLVPPPRAL